MYMKKSVCVLGKGSLAIKICEYFKQNDAWDLVGVVIEEPEPTWTDSLKDWATLNGVAYLRDLEIIRARKIDLGFSCFYGRIFKQSEIDEFGLLLNLHNGPLPKYRGVNPVNWALKNNEIEHGVTIHEIVPGIDSGPIYGQIKYMINSEKEEVIDVYNRGLHFGYSLFLDVISRINEIVPVRQDENNALTYTKKDFIRLGDRKDFKRNISHK